MDYILHYQHPSGRELTIDWGNSPNWQVDNAAFLNECDRLTLEPRNGIAQCVTVAGTKLQPMRRTLAKIDSHGRTEVRFYAVRSDSGVLWIYPNGTIEWLDNPAADPTFASEFVK